MRYHRHLSSFQGKLGYAFQCWNAVFGILCYYQYNLPPGSRSRVCQAVVPNMCSVTCYGQDLFFMLSYNIFEKPTVFSYIFLKVVFKRQVSISVDKLKKWSLITIDYQSSAHAFLKFSSLQIKLSIMCRKSHLQKNYLNSILLR